MVITDFHKYMLSKLTQKNQMPNTDQYYETLVIKYFSNVCMYSVCTVKLARVSFI